MANVKFYNVLENVIPIVSADNSANDMLSRAVGFQIMASADIGGTGAQVANVLQLTGTVRILNQWAIITSVTTLTNLTAAYATLWDGANVVNLTADGAVLSGAPVGSFFTKDKVAAQPYSVDLADQCRMLETSDDKWAGRPFTITQKNGADTFVRFHYTTTDAPVAFTIAIYFEYQPMDGGTLAFL